MTEPQGPLSGIRIVEMTGIGPVPYAAMLMADLGAEIIRIDRPGGYPAPGPNLDFAAMEAASIFYRSRPMVKADLKAPEGKALVLRLISKADALIEGYRPGAMEKLGLGPDEAHARNPALAYIRVTGWGQSGPMAQMAGHDLNYIGLSGALSLLGRDQALPVGLPPLIGDMAGGALFAVIGALSAILSAKATGRGQVVDANIVDGSASLYTLISALAAMGLHGTPGTNVLDGGRHYYRTYLCKDRKYVAVGAIEPVFRKIFLERLGLSGNQLFSSKDAADEARRCDALAAIFLSAPRDHWTQLFHDSDGCVTPVLSPQEAANDPNNTEREVFTSIDGVTQATPAPRFSQTSGHISLSPREASSASPYSLEKWGLSAGEVDDLLTKGVLEA